MPAIKKFTLIFGFTPDPQAWGVEAAGRPGGFSESYWVLEAPTRQERNTWAQLRAALLATDCGIVGYRLTPYQYGGNKLVPGHAETGLLVAAGAHGAGTNSPDDCLRMRGFAAAIPISWFLYFHALPDSCIQSGQYVPDSQFKDNLNIYTTNLRGQGLLNGAVQWLGRDPTKISQRVTKVDGALHQVTTQVATGAVAGVDFMRLRRVYDNANVPIQGTYLVTALVANPDGTVTYTLQGLPNQSRSTPSGTARVDSISVSPATRFEIAGIGERKAGRPSSLRRGRRTKVRR